MIRKCIICDKLIKRNGNAKCCSPECSRKLERESNRKYRNRPGAKVKKRVYDKIYNQKPENKVKRKKYLQKPEVIIKTKKYRMKYRIKYPKRVKASHERYKPKHKEYCKVQKEVKEILRKKNDNW